MKTATWRACKRGFTLLLSNGSLAVPSAYNTYHTQQSSLLVSTPLHGMYN